MGEKSLTRGKFTPAEGGTFCKLLLPSRPGSPHELGKIFVKLGKKNSQNPVYVTLSSSENAENRNRIVD